MDPHLAQWEGPIPTLAQPKKWNIIYHPKHTSKQINGVTDIVGFLVFRIFSLNHTTGLNHPNLCKIKFLSLIWIVSGNPLFCKLQIIISPFLQISKFCHWSRPRSQNRPYFQLQINHSFLEFSNFCHWSGSLSWTIPIFTNIFFHRFLQITNVLSLIQITIRIILIFAYEKFMLLVQFTVTNHSFFAHKIIWLLLTTSSPTIHNFTLTFLIAKLYNIFRHNISFHKKLIGLDITAVSIFVTILVELTNAIFVNSTNITTTIETTVLSKYGYSMIWLSS